MKEMMIVGRPNSGKTMFALNFAGYLGSKAVNITTKHVDGLTTCRQLGIEEAKREFCSVTLHKTRSMQSFVLKIPVGKTIASFLLTDTCGISETINPDADIRQGMAQTLKALRCAEAILHIIDLSTIFKDCANERSADIDKEIYRYGVLRRNYVMLANKVDLPAAQDAIRKIPAVFPESPIFAISALYAHGFKEVKNYVRQNI
ncbi:hypothetical protein P22_0261 [Propionispora sp. 2/2-37]|uniref:GTPase domain-containing protein n=1 Tax=Propionispora sp. 2/2-37 TaxID=1677858 RepID=UPI0006BB62C7|nr:GTPase domain-containing protein [Propionispora sp. 2/2-37]CUH94195.1 hypothetical protein P22_0261 [Propionispora sp. 2/2-37]